MRRRPGSSPGASRRLNRDRVARALTPWLLLVPAAVLYAVFIIYPIYRQFDISFYDWHIFPGAVNPGVGFKNYSAVFHDPEMKTALVNTVLFTVITVPVQMVLGLVAAAILTDRLPGRGLPRGLIFIPALTA